MTVSISDIVTDALREIGVLNAVDPPSGEDGALGLFRLNKILDNWNAERGAVYADTITPYTLTPALQPHTIGASGGTWTAAVRPVSIEGANLVNGDIRYHVRLRDAAWWMALSDPELTSAIPTDLYYEPAWPLGKVWLYPVPTTAYQFELQTRVLLAAVALSDTFTLPPGYQDALTLTLAEDLSGPLRVPLSPKTEQNAQKARGRVFGNNSRPLPLRTWDSGMPGSIGSAFDYRIGQ